MFKVENFINNRCSWDFPGSPVVKTSPSSAEDTGPIPGQKNKKHETEAILKQI